MTYFPGSAHNLTISQGAEQLAYCYYCQSCKFKLEHQLPIGLAPLVTPAAPHVSPLSWNFPTSIGGALRFIPFLLIRCSANYFVRGE
jgi:hypothetical protein